MQISESIWSQGSLTFRGLAASFPRGCCLWLVSFIKLKPDDVLSVMRGWWLCDPGQHFPRWVLQIVNHVRCWEMGNRFSDQTNPGNALAYIPPVEIHTAPSLSASANPVAIKPFTASPAFLKLILQTKKGKERFN